MLFRSLMVGANNLKSDETTMIMSKYKDLVNQLKAKRFKRMPKWGQNGEFKRRPKWGWESRVKMKKLGSESLNKNVSVINEINNDNNNEFVSSKDKLVCFSVNARHGSLTWQSTK